MQIIQKQPNPSGAYPPVQSWNRATPPDGYYEITADISRFYNGFIIPTVEDGIVTDYAPNTEAWEAWKASLPDPELPIMTLEEAILDKLTELEYRQDLITLGLAEGGVST